MTASITSKGFNGSTVPRFKQYGIHPDRIEKGKMGNPSIDAGLGPGSYNIIYSDCCVEKKLDKEKSDWHRALFLEQQGKIPHFMSKYLYKEKEEQKRQMGPGKYDIKTSIGESANHNAAPSMQSKDKRFKEEKADSFPAPGTYGKKGIPDQRLYEANESRKHCNTVGLLDRGGDSERKFYHSPYSIGPGIYQVKDGVDEMLKKRVGNRNRYDCYSEERLGPIKYGHHATIFSNDLAPGHYPHKEYINDLENNDNNFKGKFLQEAQYPRRPHQRVYYMEAGNVPVDINNQISPVSYEPRNPNYRRCEDYFGKKYPFNSSNVRMDKVALANFTGTRNPYTGPGRYYTEKFDNLRHINGAESSFKSKVQPLDSEEKLKIIRRRNRSKNMPKTNFIDHKATEKSPRVESTFHVESKLRLH